MQLRERVYEVSAGKKGGAKKKMEKVPAVRSCRRSEEKDEETKEGV